MCSNEYTDVSAIGISIEATNKSTDQYSFRSAVQLSNNAASLSGFFTAYCAAICESVGATKLSTNETAKL